MLLFTKTNQARKEKSKWKYFYQLYVICQEGELNPKTVKKMLTNAQKMKVKAVKGLTKSAATFEDAVRMLKLNPEKKEEFRKLTRIITHSENYFHPAKRPI